MVMMSHDVEESKSIQAPRKKWGMHSKKGERVGCRKLADIYRKCINYIVNEKWKKVSSKTCIMCNIKNNALSLIYNI